MINVAGGYTPHRLGEGRYRPQPCRKVTHELFALPEKPENAIAKLKA
jgi:hypothetical protein